MADNDTGVPTQKEIDRMVWLPVGTKVQLVEDHRSCIKYGQAGDVGVIVEINPTLESHFGDGGYMVEGIGDRGYKHDGSWYIQHSAVVPFMHEPEYSGDERFTEITTEPDFTRLKFYPHPGGGGVQAIAHFKNNYGVSVVRTPYTYGGDVGLFELAVLDEDLDLAGKYVCCPGSSSLRTGPDGIAGFLQPDQVTKLMIAVAELPPKESEQQ